MNKVIGSIIIALVLILSASYAGAEYIRATNEEELILVSTASEVKMGRSIAKSVEKEFGLDEDVLLQEKIDRIGQEIAAASDRTDIIYTFKVLDGPKLKPDQKINAFALPGGYVYIFREMCEMLETDDQIAAILAHEVGHIAAKHSIKRLQSSLGATFFQLLASSMADSNATKRRTNAAMGLLMTSYSREDETLADRLCVRYLKKTSYDPEAALRVMDKMAKHNKKMPIRSFTSYRSHPYLSERKAAIKTEIYGKMEFVDFINTPAVLGEQ